MPKHLHCAQCGTELLLLRKAIRGKIYDIVEPHQCSEEIAEPSQREGFVPIEKPRPPESIVEEKFAEGKFVEKLNDLKVNPVDPFSHTDDKRKGDTMRKEKTSSAPDGILASIKSMQNTIPASDISKEPGDD